MAMLTRHGASKSQHVGKTSAFHLNLFS